MTVLSYRDYTPKVAEAKRALRARGFWDGPDDSLYCKSFEESVIRFQQTEGLDDDGEIGPLTQAALDEDHGEFQPPGDRDGVLRVRVLDIAKHYIGFRERPNGSNAGPEVEQFLPRWARPDAGARGPAWCAFFVGYVVKEVHGIHVLGAHYGSVRKLWDRAHALGYYMSKPCPGDAFVLLNRNGRTGHTGFVRGVSPDGEHYYTIEGNCRNAVRAGKRRLDAPSLKGFITFGVGASIVSHVDYSDAIDLTGEPTR